MTATIEPMDLRSKLRDAEALLPTGAAPLSDIVERLSPGAAMQRIRRGQKVAMSQDALNQGHVVRGGVIALGLSIAGGPRQVIELLFPGDMILPRAVPSNAGATLVGLTDSELIRLKSGMLDGPGTDSTLWSAIAERIAVQSARRAIYAAAIGQLSGEERVATFLADLAMRGGVATSQGIKIIKIPVSRAEIADHLALNPDTLSRIMSRLRREGILGRADQRRFMIRNWDGLLKLTPAGEALLALAKRSDRSSA